MLTRSAGKNLWLLTGGALALGFVIVSKIIEGQFRFVGRSIQVAALALLKLRGLQHWPGPGFWDAEFSNIVTCPNTVWGRGNSMLVVAGVLTHCSSKQDAVSDCAIEC